MRIDFGKGMNNCCDEFLVRAMGTTNNLSRIKRVLPPAAVGLARRYLQRSKYLRYQRFLKQQGIRPERLLILGTIGKSGLHYVKFLIANYIELVDGVSDGPITPGKMEAMFPNRNWHNAYLVEGNFQEPSPHVKAIGLDDISSLHSPYWSPYWDGSRILHLYRNPLDYAVSMYFYIYEHDITRTGTVSGPAEVMDMHFNDWTEMYLAYRKLAENGSANVLRISYEDLTTNPQTCLRIILGWLGVEAVPPIVETAIQYSSKETILQMKDNKFDIERLPHFVGKHIRDGSIGQWKKYFDQSDLQRFKKQFGDVGVNLDELIMEDG